VSTISDRIGSIGSWLFSSTIDELPVDYKSGPKAKFMVVLTDFDHNRQSLVGLHGGSLRRRLC
jgi:hypothetical protein